MSKATISFLGPEGTNSEFAALKYDKDARLISVRTMYEAMMNVHNNVSQYAMCAIENSLEGSVNEVIDVLINRSNALMIYGEIIIKINHLLVGPRNFDINNLKSIYSHPQALAQCRQSISSLSSNIELIPASSTAAAVEEAMNVENACAIATEHAASHYEAEIYRENFADSEDNFTRFVVVSKNSHKPTGNDKTSIAFTTQHDKPGSLVEILKLFSMHALNLSKIESRPTKARLGTYVFLIDIDAHSEQEPLKSVLNEIMKIADWLKIIGSYPKI
ncbi:MAG: prephenate dehydratase [Dehalococcoidia bacterium]|nr:prephenate dehydratase [Dehalococcoidia bacterium]